MNKRMNEEVKIAVCKKLRVIGRAGVGCAGWVVDFPGSSAGKESACNAEEPGLIPGLGSSPGEGIGYPFQHSWASLVAQIIKNLLAM